MGETIDCNFDLPVNISALDSAKIFIGLTSVNLFLKKIKIYNYITFSLPFPPSSPKFFQLFPCTHCLTLKFIASSSVLLLLHICRCMYVCMYIHQNINTTCLVCCLWAYGNQSNRDADLVTQPFFQSFIPSQTCICRSDIEKLLLSHFSWNLCPYLSIFIFYVFIPLYLSHHQSQLILMHY